MGTDGSAIILDLAIGAAADFSHEGTSSIDDRADMHSPVRNTRRNPDAVDARQNDFVDNSALLVCFRS